MPIEIESPEQIGYQNIEANLAESSVTDAVLSTLNFQLNDLVLCYGDHFGKPELRELIVQDDAGLTRDDVLVTAGAATALFIVNTSLLKPDDHLIVAFPNYSTNIETPRAIGCQVDFLRLTFEEGFRVNLEKLAALIRPQTKLISLTTPHNPTGTMLSHAAFANGGRMAGSPASPAKRANRVMPIIGVNSTMRSARGSRTG